MILTQFAGDRMKRFVEGADRGQSTLFPAVLDDYVGVLDADHPGASLCGGYDPDRPLLWWAASRMEDRSLEMCQRAHCRGVLPALYGFRGLCFGCRFIGLGHTCLPRRPRLESPLVHSPKLLPQR